MKLSRPLSVLSPDSCLSHGASLGATQTFTPASSSSVPSSVYLWASVTTSPRELVDLLILFNCLPVVPCRDLLDWPRSCVCIKFCGSAGKAGGQ
ncbi:hypothetical protein BDV18DRAFT_99771 [Aspergillus unguis]